MVLYLQESEMISRYVDSLKRSASKIKEFTEAGLNKQPEILVTFIDGLKQAAGSAHQLAHAQENPKWLSVRDILEKIIEVSQVLPTFKIESYHLWMKIKKQLEELSESGVKMALSKALPRHEVLSLLKTRMTNLPKNE